MTQQPHPGLNREHELHTRRFGRNAGVALVLVLFIALVFGLTVVKITRGDQMQGFDHTYRPEIDPDTIDPGAIAPDAIAPGAGIPASVAEEGSD